MMRGMFSAISGLKNHQMMLDVTANDIANVNTIGYKSARTTFKDSLTQMQRGGRRAGGAKGGTNAAQVGLGVRLGSIDNLMGGGALQTTGDALDVGDPGRRVLPRRPGTAAGTRPAARRSTPARATSRANARRRPRDAGGLLRRRLHRDRTRRRPDHADQHPAGRARTSRWARTARSATSRPAAATASSRATCRSPRSPNPSGLERALGQPLDRLAELRRARRSPRPATTARPDHRPASVEMSNVDLAGAVHADDHRPARLPGQLARHLDVGRDAAGPGEPQALARRPGARPRGGRTPAARLAGSVEANLVRGAAPAGLEIKTACPRRSSDRAMIRLHRLGHMADEPFHLNPDLILTVEAHPGHRGDAHDRDKVLVDRDARRGRATRCASGAPRSSTRCAASPRRASVADARARHRRRRRRAVARRRGRERARSTP